MISIKNKAAIAKMHQAGQYLVEIMDHLAAQYLKPGVTTLFLDSIIAQELKKRKLVSQTLGYHGYKHVCCLSVNDVVVHGVPSHEIVLKDGDLVKIDICASWQGYCADMARCFVIGKAEPTIQHFIQVACQALDLGIAQAVPGNRLSDISAAIQHEVERHGFGVVRDFAGHGIGKKMHEEPEILNYGKAGKGPLLRPGMTFAIEPMITMGKFDVYIAPDGWTVKTVDKSLAAHVEDTIAITEQGPYVLTRVNQ